MREIDKTGLDQYKYMTRRVIERTTPVFDSISTNQMPLFSRPPSRGPSKTKQTITSLKSDCTLFSQLCIATQTGDGDLDNFFKPENHAYPLFLSLLENFCLGQNLTSSSVWKSCAHHAEKHQWLTSSYWMVLLPSTC